MRNAVLAAHTGCPKILFSFACHFVCRHWSKLSFQVMIEQILGFHLIPFRIWKFERRARMQHLNSKISLCAAREDSLEVIFDLWTLLNWKWNHVNLQMSASAIFSLEAAAVKVVGMSIEERIWVAVWYEETKSPVEVQSRFRAHFGRNGDAPQHARIMLWHENRAFPIIPRQYQSYHFQVILKIWNFEYSIKVKAVCFEHRNPTLKWKGINSFKSISTVSGSADQAEVRHAQKYAGFIFVWVHMAKELGRPRSLRYFTRGHCGILASRMLNILNKTNVWKNFFWKIDNFGIGGGIMGKAPKICSSMEMCCVEKASRAGACQDRPGHTLMMTDL